MSITTIGGLLVALVLFIAGAFTTGKSAGKKQKEIKSLEEENELLQRYRDIDSQPNVADALDRL